MWKQGETNKRAKLRNEAKGSLIKIFLTYGFNYGGTLKHIFWRRCCSHIIVYLLDSQGTSFLLLFKWLIKKRLWQFDGSLSDGHPWLYPTCQGGMNCPSYQRSPLILLVKIVERHKHSTEKASNDVTIGKKKKRDSYTMFPVNLIL